MNNKKQFHIVYPQPPEAAIEEHDNINDAIKQAQKMALQNHNTKFYVLNSLAGAIVPKGFQTCVWDNIDLSKSKKKSAS